MLTARRKGSDYHHGDLKASAINCGRDLIREGGLSALKIRKIADQLQVTPASLYRHFESLDALQSEIALTVRDELADFMIERRDAKRRQSPELRMKEIYNAYIDFAQNNPRLFEIAYLTFEGFEIEHAEDRAWQVLIKALGEFPKKLPEGLEMFIWSSAHGFATLVAQGAIDPKNFKKQKNLVLMTSLKLL